MGGDLRPKAALTVHPFAQPDRLRDEELVELEDELCKLTCDCTGQGRATQVAPAGSKSPVSCPTEEKPLPAACQTFLFHGQPVGEVHQQKLGSPAGRSELEQGWAQASAGRCGRVRAPGNPYSPLAHFLCSEPATDSSRSADVCALGGPQVAQGGALAAA